ncbi:MAG: response regulator [Burkholderiales bacterium]|nr:response regulator [Burkholderiales bacterium]
MKVLYVDDDRINTLLFTETCRMAGRIEVRTADSGAEALERVRDWAPELAVIDLHLPDTLGYALLPALRAALAAPALRAFLCTADDGAEVGEAARAAGFAGCWTKPVDLATVVAELSRRPGDEGAR